MKAFCKSVLRLLSTIAVMPVIVAYRLHAAMCGCEEAFPGWSQLFSLVPGKLGVYLRHAFHQFSLRQCGDDTCLSFGTIISHPGATIGSRAYVGNFCSLGNIEIGEDVLIASHVSIMNGCHQHGIDRLDVPVREQVGTYDPISIGRDSWIGERATVAASVGQHCVIGAGALVLHPIPDYAIAVGVPARVVGDRRKAAQAKSPQLQLVDGRR